MPRQGIKNLRIATFKIQKINAVMKKEKIRLKMKLKTEKPKKAKRAPFHDIRKYLKIHPHNHVVQALVDDKKFKYIESYQNGRYTKKKAIVLNNTPKEYYLDGPLGFYSVKLKCIDDDFTVDVSSKCLNRILNFEGIVKKKLLSKYVLATRLGHDGFFLVQYGTEDYEAHKKAKKEHKSLNEMKPGDTALVGTHSTRKKYLGKFIAECDYAPYMAEYYRNNSTLSKDVKFQRVYAFRCLSSKRLYFYKKPHPFEIKKTKQTRKYQLKKDKNGHIGSLGQYWAVTHLYDFDISMDVMDQAATLMEL